MYIQKGMRRAVSLLLTMLLVFGFVAAPITYAEEPATPETAATEPEPTSTPAAEPAPTATPQPTATAEPTAEPATPRLASAPTLPGPPVMQTSETGLTDEEIAALTQGMLSPMDDEGIMTLADTDHDDNTLLGLIADQLHEAGDQKYWDAFEHATGISYNYDSDSGTYTASTASGTLNWATPPAGCSAPWTGDKTAVMPVAGVYHIKTAEELAWVMNQFAKNSSTVLEAVLDNDIDLNGKEHYWTPGNMNKGEQILDGNGHTIYNLCVSKNPGNVGFVLQADKTSCIKNLTFDTGYILNNGTNQYTGVIAQVYSGPENVEYSNLHAKNLVVCSKSKNNPSGQTGALFGRIEQKDPKTNTRTTLLNCTAQDCTVLGKDHVGSLTGCVLTTDAKYCYSTGCTVISYGAHSGGLFSCANGATFSNCFTDVRLYGSKETGVFIGGLDNRPITFTNCAASGFVDGDTVIGGFAGGIQSGGQVTFTNCYTTALVGVNSDENATGMGGFIGGIGVDNGDPNYLVNKTVTKVSFKNCYAGGEVGNVHTAMKPADAMGELDNPNYTNGGFVGNICQDIKPEKLTFTNSYYDKQTTAMREQGTGYFATTNSAQTFPIGVLTTQSDKAGAGLTGDPGATGFTGFATKEENNADQWSTALPQHYPELTEFKDAVGGNGWASEEMANTARAFSLSSTSTVLLDTWDKGLNTDTGEMNAATPGVNVYCTVRDLTSGFPLTSDNKNSTENTNSNSWIPVANAYGETEKNAKSPYDNETDVLSLKHSNGTYLCDELVPGMEWLLVSNTVGGQTVTRHVRVTPTAAIDAGASKMITKDDPNAYNHRTDVQMFFSTAAAIGASTPTVKHGGYPDSSVTNASYKDVPVNNTISIDPSVTDNATGSKVYVYLREITGFDADGKIQTEPPAGEAPIGWDAMESGTTTYAQAFNGEERLDNNDKRYLLTYMWQLGDGRVVQDAKIVRTAKVPFTVALNVFHNMNGTTLDQYLEKAKETGTAVVPTDYTDKLYTGGVKTDAQKAGASITLQNAPKAVLAESSGVDLHQKAEVAWKLNDDVNDYIASVTLTMDLIKSAEGETKEAYTRTFTTGRDADGNTIPLQNGALLDMKYTLYRIVYKNGTFFSIPEEIVRTYTLQVTDGTYSLKFAKNGTEGAANAPGDVFTQEGVDPVYFNDIEFNLRTDVVVGHKYNLFSLTKKVTGNLSDPDKVFDFTGVCEVKNVNEAGNVTYTKLAKGTELPYTLTGETTPQTVTVGDDGKIELKLKHGQTATFINVPFDQITVTENIETTDGYTTSYTTTHGTVDAESNRTQVGTASDPATNTATTALDITRAGYVYNSTTGEYEDTAGKYVDLTFINNRENVPPTGIREDAAPFVVLGSFTLAGLALLLALAYTDNRRRNSTR